MSYLPIRVLALLRHLMWMCQPFRAFVSMGLIVCMVFSLMPLGCHSVQVRHGLGRTGQPQIPEVTAEQLKECGELVQDGIKPGWRQVDAQVELDESGRVLAVKTEGEPNPEVGMCIRIALRSMRVRKDVIEDAALRTPSYAAPYAEMKVNRAYMGEIVTVTVVVIVFTEVIIETVAVVVGVAVTATVAQHAVAAAQARSAAAQAKSAPARKPHQPVREKWEKNGGTVRDNPDGSTTFTRKDGVAVTYGQDGFPDFTPYRHPTVKDVHIEFTGKYGTDRARANAASNLTETPVGWRWHHHQDGKTMQLIRSDVHEEFFHTGGMAGTRK